jgi:hypothetical protein
MVDKYGATIKDTEGAKEMIARQREMKIAMDGVKITLGTALMPAIEAIRRRAVEGRCKRYRPSCGTPPRFTSSWAC